jgi:hypothetical protein
MKKKIYVLPQSPSPSEMEVVLDNLRPQLNQNIKNRVLESFTNIQTRLLSIPINETNFHFNQSQTFSDPNHTIILKGQLQPPTFLQKLSEMF